MWLIHLASNYIFGKYFGVMWAKWRKLDTVAFLSNPASSHGPQSYLMDYLVTLNKVIGLLWVPLSSVVWRDIPGTAFTDILTSFYRSFTKQYSSLCNAIWYFLLFIKQNCWSWPTKLISQCINGSDMQLCFSTLKNTDKATNRDTCSVNECFCF